MLTFNRRRLLGTGLGALACAGAGSGSSAAARPAGQYSCPPCGCAADGVLFNAPGACPACGMRLVARSAEAATLPFEPDIIESGVSAFLVRGGVGLEDRRIAVHCYRPRGFDAHSPILLVVPGAGRNGDAYRDSWIEAAEAHTVLVAALSYPEAEYDFAAYQMGGVIRNLELRNVPLGPDGGLPDSLHMRDEDILFELDDRPETWLFNDFDRIFDVLARAAGSSRTRYDLFGHSAGGQILHRLALFRPRSQAGRIVAANAGFYTLPDFDLPQPFGLKGVGLTEADLAAAFACDLTILLGELDNDPEAGGQHLHTPLADRQGVDRLARGRHFLEAGRNQAARLGLPFDWRLELVPGVGHDYRAMGRAAARLLYG